MNFICKRSFCFGLLIMVLGGQLSAQPAVEIREDDVPFLIGQWARYDQNVEMFEWDPFDSMRTWWDLTGYPGGSVARVYLLDPNQGIPPAPDSFPAAEIVELDSMGSGDVTWSYMENNNLFFYLQGIDFVTGGYRFIGNYQPDYRIYNYPIYDGSGWNSAFQWQWELMPGVWYVANETHQKDVVSMGKVRANITGEQFWPCLVIRDYMTFSDNMGTNTSYWIYEWVVPGRFGGGNGVAAAQSRNGASQNFMIVENFFNLNQLYVPGWDLDLPEFANTTIWPDTSYLGPYVVSSTITDSTGIGADSLFYNIDGGSFTGVGHDSVIGDQYYFTIPQVAPPCSVGYFLWAEDSFCVANAIDIWNTDPICAPESTHYQFYVSTVDMEELTSALLREVKIYPNPFRNKTTISYQIAGAYGQNVGIEIYDRTGRRVKQFALSVTDAINEINWDGCDDRGRKVSSGVYFVRINTESDSKIKTVLRIE